MIRTKDLTVRFREKVAVDRVDLHVGEGEVVLLSGANGCGKSTLLRVLAGLLEPSSGSAEIAGQAPDTAAVRALRGFVQDDPPLYEYLTSHEHLAFAARLWGVPVEDSLELLARFGAEDWAGTLIRDLSLGTRKKVGLAAALTHRPRLLLLDEPFNGLDAGSCDELALLLKEARDEGCTVLLTAHEPQHVEQLLDRRIFLDRRGHA
ncbi:ABC transporter ATP-binding protein [Streptomyces sp. NPDC006265]|uniref:ABC transporter ATP-binding protein n=1 Tax=Streptomyces sp. NPDC006265 TaxID=3156740 RepID=UPI0033B1929F